jgi:hypothetical protein
MKWTFNKAIRICFRIKRIHLALPIIFNWIKLLEWNSKFWSDRQFWKHPAPILTTEFGIVSDDNDEHAKKHHSPREWTEFGIMRDDNDEHLKKQQFPREWTEFGIARDNNDEQL